MNKHDMITRVNYMSSDESLTEREDLSISKGGVAKPFPWRLHECLAVAHQEGLEQIISWKPHGRAFTVHDPDKFVESVISRFFGQTKFASFQRQLNLYGFQRFIRGPDKGAYFHLNFIRGHTGYVRDMPRLKIKGKRRSSIMLEEPDFYAPEWENHKKPSYPPGLKKAPSKLYPTALRKMSARLKSIEVGSQPSFKPVQGETRGGRQVQLNHGMMATEVSWNNTRLDIADMEPTPFPQHEQGVLRLVDPASNTFSVQPRQQPRQEPLLNDFSPLELGPGEDLWENL